MDIQQIKTVEGFRENIIRTTLLQYVNERIASNILRLADMNYVDGVSEENLQNYLMTLYDICGDYIKNDCINIAKTLEKEYAIFAGKTLGVDVIEEPHHSEISDIITRLESNILKPKSTKNE